MSGKLTNQRPCPMMAKDLSVQNMDRDNNNIWVETLSLAKAGAVEAPAVIRSQEADTTKRNSEKLRALLLHLAREVPSEFFFYLLPSGGRFVSIGL